MPGPPAIRVVAQQHAPQSEVPAYAAPNVDPRVDLAVGALALLLGTGALLLGRSVEPASALSVTRAVVEAAAIVLPVAVGIYALRWPHTSQFARLLIVLGIAWAPAALAMSSASVPYSIGRVWAWFVIAGVVYMLLAFPVGRLSSSADRFLFGSAVVLLAVAYLPTALIAQFPVPSPWAACDTDCPRNALMVVHDTPSFVPFLVKLRDSANALLFAAAAAVVATRFVRGSRVARKVHGPVLGLAIVNFAAMGAFLVVRQVAPDNQLTDWIGVVALACTPALVLAFFAGLIHWRFSALATWRRMEPDLRGPAGAERIRALIADAIRDSTLEIAYWDTREERWIDGDGLPYPVPREGPLRATTVIRSGNEEPIALLVYENSYLAESAVHAVVQGVAVMALENQRLETESRAALRELGDSRARILAAIDRDRLQIERDLHDGAQQRLIGMKVTAERAAEAAAHGSADAFDVLKRISADAAAALDEIRSLARGVYPPLLVDHGLVEALKDLATRSPLRVEVRAHGVGRYPQEVEAAVYFCCLEALQNAEKHSGADFVLITVTSNGRIRFEVRDDGHGFDTTVPGDGTGLGHMHDRVATVGGRLELTSVIDGGTRIAGQVPVSAIHLSAETERLVLRAADMVDDAVGIYRVVRTASGRIIDFAVEHVNPAACRMVGISREAQVGRTLGQLHPGYPRSAAFRWHCEALDATEPLIREEFEYSGPPGSRRLQVAYEVQAAALGGGHLALVWRDITARKRAEHQLQLKAAAFGMQGEGVCIIRAETARIVYANRRLEELLGYADGELEGRAASELDSAGAGERQGPGLIATARAAWPAYERTEARAARKDGAPLWCETLMDGFDDPDLGWCWVALIRDITHEHEERERVEAQDAHLARALRTLPALGYSADHDLQCTILFDNLIEPEVPGSRTGTDRELFGESLGPVVTEVNARVLVIGEAAQTTAEVETSLGRVRVIVAAEPEVGPDGMVTAVSGTVLMRPDARRELEAAPHQPLWSRRFRPASREARDAEA